MPDIGLIVNARVYVGMDDRDKKMKYTLKRITRTLDVKVLKKSKVLSQGLTLTRLSQLFIVLS